MTEVGRRRSLEVGALLAAALVVRLLWFIGPRLVDDLVYAEVASELWRRGWPAQDSIWNLRIGFVGLIAAGFGVFGVSSFTLALPSLVASLAQVALTTVLGIRHFGRAAGLTAGALLAVNPADVFFATEAHTDLCLAAFTTGAFLMARGKDGWEGWRRCLISGLLLGAGHLFKEMAILPAACLLAIMAATRAGRKPVAAVAAGYLSILVLEGLAYAAFRGDFLHRFAVARAEQHHQLFSGLYLESVPTGRRILLDFVSLLFNPLNPDFLYTGLLQGGFLAAAVVHLRARRRETFLVLGWWAGILALMNFWPVSLVPYRPALVAFPWLLVHLSAPAALATAAALAPLGSKSKAAIAGIGAAYALLSLCCVSVLRADVRTLQDPVVEALRRLPSGTPVVTDPRTITLMRFYQGYPEESALRSWSDPRPPGEWYYVENPIWFGMMAGRYGTTVPADLEKIAKEAEPLFTASRSGRLRWRGLLRGRVERTAWPPLRIFRVRGS